MEIDIPEFEDLKEWLVKNRNGKVAAGGSQVTIRCPYCGDSRNPRNQHMYIGPDRRNSMVLSYHCFLCNCGGALHPKFFRDIECYETDIINAVCEYNRNIWRNGPPKNSGVDENRKRKRGPRKQAIIRPPDPGEDENIQAKLSYINHRLGVRMTLEDTARLKIILNLNRYLRDNHVWGSTRNKEIMAELSRVTIGFLSVDNSHVILRTVVDPSEIRLSENLRRRYINYTIFTAPGLYLYYVIPGIVDPSKPIKVCITEGPFDILGVYFHVVKDHNNCIFAAAAGKTGYCGLMEYLFTKIRIPPHMCELHVFSDNDMNIKEYDDLLKDMYIVNTRGVVLHRNAYPGEKDYGVPGHKINDTIIYI